MSYEGSCHCGAVAFEVQADLPEDAYSCNCSHCRRHGLLLTFVPREALVVKQGDDVLTDYRFYKNKIAHKICPTCGCQTFSEAKAPDGREMAAINLRMVPEADLDALTLKPVDGASY